MENTNEIIKEVFIQAKEGLVKIDTNDMNHWNFFVRFYTSIEGKINKQDSNYPILIIPSYKLFLKKVNNYLNIASDFYYKDKDYFDLDDFSYHKKLFLDLIVNASSYDFNNIYEYIDLRTEMIINDKIKEETIELGNFNNYKVISKIKKNHSNLEGPYTMNIAFLDNNEESFVLPALTYGIVNDRAYLMSVQNKREKQINKTSKTLDRLFRKVNKDLDMESDIANVSPNALVSLVIFNKYLKLNNIKEVIASDYLPIRYHSNKVNILNKYRDNKEEKEIALSKHNRDQFNITNKFIYLLNRYDYYFDSNNTYYDDITCKMHLFLDGKNREDDNLVYLIDDSIKVNQKGLNKR